MVPARQRSGSVSPNKRRPIRSEQISMDTYVCIAPDVKLGRDVKLSKFINLYGCEIGDETKIGAFVEIQKNATVGKRCKISSHTFICEGVSDRRQRLHRPRRNVHQRPVSARNHGHRRLADRSRLASGTDGGEKREPRSVRVRPSSPIPASERMPLWGQAPWSPKMFRPTPSWPAIQPEFFVKLKRG